MEAASSLLGTAATHAIRDVPVHEPDETAGTVWALLAGRGFTSVADVEVCKGDRLVGLVPIERLLAAPAPTPLGELMDDDPPIVAATVDQEVAAWRMVEHGERSLAVVDRQGRFAGLIPPGRMLAVLLEEHDEDLRRLSGVLSGTEAARSASLEPVGRRLWHRLPWLIVGLVGSLAAAAVVGAFERSIEEEVLLAVFIPGVVYMADAVGTQTEALVIRGLSIGVPMRSVVRRELATGLVVGVVIAMLFAPLGLLIWGAPDVIVTVSLALLAACSTATAVALALPWLLFRLGRDPAFGSGPLATVIQDVLSVAIYLTIATVVVG